MVVQKFSRWRVLILGTAVMGLWPLLEANGQPRPPDALAAKGQTIAEVYCARCHAVARSGASPLPAAPPLRTLSEKYPIESLAEALAEGIVTGHSEMPEFVFAPDEVDAVLAFLKSLETPP